MTMEIIIFRPSGKCDCGTKNDQHAGDCEHYELIGERQAPPVGGWTPLDAGIFVGRQLATGEKNKIMVEP